MDEVNIEFNNYIEQFKKADTLSKMNEIISSIKELVTFIDIMSQNEQIELSYLKSNEILDLQKPDVNYNDYLEAILVYIEVSKDLLGQYVEKTSLKD